MRFLDIIKIGGFLLGTVLHIAILRLIVQRRGRKGHEIFFILLVCATLLWYVGNFSSLFLGQLWHPHSHIYLCITHVIAMLGAVFIYPFLLHTLLYFSQECGFKVSGLLKGLLLVYSYLPVAAFPMAVAQLFPDCVPDLIASLSRLHLNRYFMGWAISILLLSWLFTLSIQQRVEDAEERRLYRIISWLFIGMGLFMSVTFILPGYQLPLIGPYLGFFSQMSAILPTTAFAYYIYRYNHMEFVFKRSLLYSILGILVVSLYLLGIRPLGQWLGSHTQLHFEIIEGSLVLLMIFCFDPLKLKLQELTNKLFFKEEKYYQKVFKDLSSMINTGTYLDLPLLLDSVAYTVAKAMNFAKVSIVIFQQDNDRVEIVESTQPRLSIDFQPIIAYIEKYHLKRLNLYELDNKELIRQMKEIDAVTILPVYHENRLFGFFNLGKRRFKRQLLAEEEEMLTILANQLAVAIANTRLAREKLTLERRMYENEKLSSLGRLSASIAHEVKNPLSSIKIITQVLMEDLPPDDPNQEGLAIINSEIDRLTRVVNQLLQFARPDAKEKTAVAMGQVINDIIMLLGHEAKKNQVVIQTQINDEIHCFAEKDALSEIFFNLIHNSIQAMPAGGTVRVIVQLTSQHEIQVQVCDTGPGIAPSEREKIFEPFFTTKQTGTGLGLTIVRQKLARLHGRLSIKDNDYDGRGVIFEVCLPLEESAHDVVI